MNATKNSTVLAEEHAAKEGVGGQEKDDFKMYTVKGRYVTVKGLFNDRSCTACSLGAAPETHDRPLQKPNLAKVSARTHHKAKSTPAKCSCNTDKSGRY